MGIALLALSELFTPLQSLAHRWVPGLSARSTRDKALTLDANLRYVHVRPGQITPSASPAGTLTSLPTRSAVRPSHTQRPLPVLRVLRVAEHSSTGMTSASARVVLSGRLEDVCAELDRLAALEAAQRPTANPRHLH